MGSYTIADGVRSTANVLALERRLLEVYPDAYRRELPDKTPAWVSMSVEPTDVECVACRTLDGCSQVVWACPYAVIGEGVTLDGSAYPHRLRVYLFRFHWPSIDVVFERLPPEAQKALVLAAKEASR